MSEWGSREQGPNSFGWARAFAFATMMGAKCDRIWQQRGESFEAFERRVKAAADEARASPGLVN